MKILYIMPPDLFEHLKNVRGFTDKNGTTYIEHICIRFNTHLTDDQQKKIKSQKSIHDALNSLKEIINFTHIFTP